MSKFRRGELPARADDLGNRWGEFVRAGVQFQGVESGFRRHTQRQEDLFHRVRARRSANPFTSPANVSTYVVSVLHLPPRTASPTLPGARVAVASRAA